MLRGRRCVCLSTLGIGASCTNAPILAIPLTSEISHLLKPRHSLLSLSLEHSDNRIKHAIYVAICFGGGAFTVA